MALGHFPVSPDRQVWARSCAPRSGVIHVDVRNTDGRLQQV